MPRPKNTAWTKYRPRPKPTYVLSPTFETEEELDEALNKVRVAYPDSKRIPQDICLRLMGYDAHLSVRDMKNDILTDTMTKHTVTDKSGNVLYWYARWDIVHTTRFVSNMYALGNALSANDYAC